MAGPWGSYSELSSSGGGSTSWQTAGNPCECETFDPLDRGNTIIQSRKLGSWDLAYGRVEGDEISAKEVMVDQECPSWPSRVSIAQGFQTYGNGMVDQGRRDFVVAGQGVDPMGASSSGSSSIVSTNTGARFNVDGTFLDESADANVATSSCHFPVSDNCYGQTSSTFKEVADDWEAIGNLADIDDLLGHNSGFVQPNSLEVHGPLAPPGTKTFSESCKKLEFEEQRQPVLIQHDQQATPTKRLKTPSPWSFKSEAAHPQRHTFQQEFSSATALPVMEPQGSDNTNGIEQLLLLQRAMNYNRAVQASYAALAGTTSQPPLTSTGATSSFLGDSSLEAALLYQLGCTMTKLDIGTRLCIRNALYRLAKSASHRNGDDAMSSIESPGKRPGDIPCLETCTNSIDRTVASLLFYKQEADTAPDQSSGSASPQSTVVSSNSWIQPSQQVAAAMAAAPQSTAGGGAQLYVKW